MVRKIILNENFYIVAVIVVMIPQIAHTYYVYNINSQYADPWFGWCFAIGIDTAILIFTLRGWIYVAGAYFIGTLAVNLLYLEYPESIWSKLLIGVMLSSTIFSLSHLFYKKRKSG